MILSALSGLHAFGFPTTYLLYMASKDGKSETGLSDDIHQKKFTLVLEDEKNTLASEHTKTDNANAETENSDANAENVKAKTLEVTWSKARPGLFFTDSGLDKEQIQKVTLHHLKRINAKRFKFHFCILSPVSYALVDET